MFVFQETEEVLKQGEPNYHETVELAKTVIENEILVDKKAKDAENDMKNLSIRYNQVLEDVQKKKNKYEKHNIDTRFCLFLMNPLQTLTRSDLHLQETYMHYISLILVSGKHS